MSEYPDVLKFDQNVIYQVTMLWDKPLKPVEGKYGTFIPYRVTYNGVEVSINASETLSLGLSKYKKGDVITIIKEKKGDESVNWKITKSDNVPYKDHHIPGDSGNEEAEINESKPDWDLINARKTHDIHKQVCLKLAVVSIEDWDLTEITKRTNELMTVLDLIQFEDSIQESSEEQKGLNPGMVKNIETLAEKFWGKDWEKELTVSLVKKYDIKSGVNIGTYKKLLIDEQGLMICTGLKEAIAIRDKVNPADVQNSLKNTQDLERMDIKGMRDLFLETLRDELKLSKTAALIHANKMSLQTHSKEYDRISKDEIRTLLLEAMKTKEVVSSDLKEETALEGTKNDEPEPFDRDAIIRNIVDLIPKMGGQKFPIWKGNRIGDREFNKLPDNQLIKFLSDLELAIKE